MGIFRQVSRPTYDDDARSQIQAAQEAKPSDRAAFLDRVCAGNAALRQRVEALLQADASPEPPATSLYDDVYVLGDQVKGSYH